MVRITTDPDGAEVFLNNQPIGETPLTTELSDFVANRYNVRIEKAGYDDLNVTLQKEVKVGTVIGALFIWPLWPWIWGPADQQTFRLHESR